MKYYISIFTLFFLLQIGATAQQVVGGDITWECLSSGTNQGKYVFELNLFNMCNAGSLPSSATIKVYRNPTLSSIAMSFVSDVDINPPCYDSILQVNCANNSPDAVSMTTYRSQPLTLSGIPPANGWVFTYATCCRPNAANIQGNPGFTLRSIMYGNTALGGPNCYDNSPKFIDEPSPFICQGYPFNITNRAYDSDFDKVIHSWALSMDSSMTWPANGVIWNPGYNTNSQFPGTFHHTSNSPASLLPYNGEIGFNNMSTQGRIFYNTKISSYKDTVLVSEVFRDSYADLRNCPQLPPPISQDNTPPSVEFKEQANSPVGIPLPMIDTIIAGDSISRYITSTDVQFLPGFSPQTNYLIARGEQFAYDFDDRLGGCNNPPCATLDHNNFYNSTKNYWEGPFGIATRFEWRTDSSQGAANGKVYHFHFKVYDDWCPFPGINEHTYTIVVIKPDNYIEGTVYKDINGNGNKDSIEPVMPNILIKQKPHNFYFNSRFDGTYSIGSNKGVNTISAIPPLYHQITEPSSIDYTITTTGTGNTYGGNDFGFQAIPNINDLQVHISTAGATRPGFFKVYWLTCINKGTTTLNASLAVDLDNGMNFVSSVPSSSAGSGSTYVWNFNNLPPGQTKLVKVKTYLDSSINIGDSLHVFTRLDPIVGDTTPVNNKDSILRFASNSLDPNLKVVEPGRDFYIDEIKDGNILEYTIHFQNTGNDTAINVRIVDELEASLNIETIEMLASSHSYNYEVRGREITWFFDDIKLVDSTTDELNSHGFLSFQIVADTNLNLGDSVFNEASIYFDFNAPVITNVTSFIIEEPEDTSGNGVVQDILNKQVAIFPNPAEDIVTLRINTYNNESFKVDLFDLTGNLLFQHSFISSGGIALKSFDVSTLDKGMYVVRISSGRFSVGKKFIKK